VDELQKSVDELFSERDAATKKLQDAEKEKDDLALTQKSSS